MSIDQDTYTRLAEALDAQQMRLFEMASMVGEYRAALAEAHDGGDSEAIKLMRQLPGARYHVATTYLAEQWKVLAVEMKRAFPDGD